jgi:hypothetical protein
MSPLDAILRRRLLASTPAAAPPPNNPFLAQVELDGIPKFLWRRRTAEMDERCRRHVEADRQRARRS